jgi:DNA-binding transcriptional LysR family regulator
MDLRHFDLNLLRVLDALLKERHVTQAAQRLGLSQPAVSAALARLREAFGDELFVKRPHGVEPTARALALEAPLALVLATIRERLLDAPGFDPATSARAFTLIVGEVGQAVFAPRLLARLRALAPQATVRFVYPDADTRLAMLEDGRADLAIGPFPRWSDSDALFQQKLYARPLLGVARAGHPALADGALTLARFAALDHAIVGARSDFDRLVEPALQRLKLARRVVAELGHVAGAAQALAALDLVAIVPATLAETWQREAGLQAFALPFELPPHEVKQFWHRTRHRDPAVTWLRELVATEFQH